MIRSFFFDLVVFFGGLSGDLMWDRTACALEEAGDAALRSLRECEKSLLYQGRRNGSYCFIDYIDIINQNDARWVLLVFEERSRQGWNSRFWLIRIGQVGPQYREQLNSRNQTSTVSDDSRYTIRMPKRKSTSIINSTTLTSSNCRTTITKNREISHTWSYNMLRAVPFTKKSNLATDSLANPSFGDISRTSVQLLSIFTKITLCTEISKLKISWSAAIIMQNCVTLVSLQLSSLEALYVVPFSIWPHRWSRKSHTTTRSIFGP